VVIFCPRIGYMRNWTLGNVLDFVTAIEQCSIKEAGLKLKQWFAVDYREVREPSRASTQSTTQIKRGIYCDATGKQRDQANC
jgi:hypothetical protein